MTRDELAARMSFSELVEWLAFDQIDRLPDRRADLNFALLRCQIANMFRGPTTPAMKFQDFMLRFEPPAPKKQTLMEQLAKMKVLTIASQEAANARRD